MNDIITAKEATNWLGAQVLLFASRPAPDNKRLRMWYRVAEGRWEIVVGNAEETHPVGGYVDVNSAVTVFNTLAAEYEAKLAQPIALP